MTKIKTIHGCPTCRKPLVYDVKNPWRPFCSERCKTQDVAAWATDAYQIAGEPSNRALDSDSGGFGAEDDIERQ